MEPEEGSLYLSEEWHVVMVFTAQEDITTTFLSKLGPRERFPALDTVAGSKVAL